MMLHDQQSLAAAAAASQLAGMQSALGGDLSNPLGVAANGSSSISMPNGLNVGSLTPTSLGQQANMLGVNNIPSSIAGVNVTSAGNTGMNGLGMANTLPGTSQNNLMGTGTAIPNTTTTGVAALPNDPTQTLNTTFQISEYMNNNMNMNLALSQNPHLSNMLNSNNMINPMLGGSDPNGLIYPSGQVGQLPVSSSNNLRFGAFCAFLEIYRVYHNF